MAKKGGAAKTNAMRILEKLGIAYEALAYDDDGEHALAKAPRALPPKKSAWTPPRSLRQSSCEATQRKFSYSFKTPCMK